MFSVFNVLGVLALVLGFWTIYCCVLNPPLTYSIKLSSIQVKSCRCISTDKEPQDWIQDWISLTPLYMKCLRLFLLTELFCAESDVNVSPLNCIIKTAVFTSCLSCTVMRFFSVSRLVSDDFAPYPPDIFAFFALDVKIFHLQTIDMISSCFWSVNVNVCLWILELARTSIDAWCAHLTLMSQYVLTIFSFNEFQKTLKWI